MWHWGLNQAYLLALLLQINWVCIRYVLISTSLYFSVAFEKKYLILVAVGVTAVTSNCILSYYFLCKLSEPYGRNVCFPFHYYGKQPQYTDHCVHKNRIYGCTFKSLPAMLYNLRLHEWVSPTSEST